MYQPVTLFIGLRYMRGRASDRFARFVSWLSAIGIALGVIALIVVMSVMNGFEQRLKNSLLSFMPQAVITTASGSLNPQQFPASKLNTLHGVERIVPLTTAEVVIQSAGHISVGIMLGINPQDDEPLMQMNYFAKEDSLDPGSYRVIVGQRLANELNIQPGDQIRLLVPSVAQLTPLGRIPSQRLFTVVGIFSSRSEADATQLLVNQQDASRLMRYPIGNITGWRLYLEQPLNVATLSHQSLEEGLVWQDWRSRKGELFQAVKMEKGMMGLLISLIIIVAAFNLITSLGLLVMEKQGEVAILQTQGLKKQQIMRVFIIQGATSGIVGALLGSLLGILLTLNLDKIVPSISGIRLPVVIEPVQVIIIVAFSIALSLIATLYPSWRATKVQPAVALRHE